MAYRSRKLAHPNQLGMSQFLVRMRSPDDDMGRQSWNKKMLEIVGARPIAFHPYLAQIAKSATAGLLMSQLLYWWGKGRYCGWIYQTIEQIQSETGLTRSEQNTAIAKWVQLGVLEKKLMSIPRKRFFRIDIDKLSSLLLSEARSAKSDKLYRRSEHANTESTSESPSRDIGFSNLSFIGKNRDRPS